jgi:hypothetical protein
MRLARTRPLHVFPERSRGAGADRGRGGAIERPASRRSRRAVGRRGPSRRRRRHPAAHRTLGRGAAGHHRGQDGRRHLDAARTRGNPDRRVVGLPRQLVALPVVAGSGHVGRVEAPADGDRARDAATGTQERALYREPDRHRLPPHRRRRGRGHDPASGPLAHLEELSGLAFFTGLLLVATAHWCAFGLWAADAAAVVFLAVVAAIWFAKGSATDAVGGALAVAALVWGVWRLVRWRVPRLPKPPRSRARAPA